VSASRHRGVGYTAGTVPIAFIAFDFDPLVRILDDVVVRWQTLALAAVIAACLVVAGVMARRARLRGDDLLFIAIGAVPGAVLLGRVGYGLAHLDAFGTDPLRLLDPSVGGLDLAMGVVGGVLAGAYVASLLDAPVGRWAHVLALPLLIAIGAGKLTMVLGGSGQGLPSDAAWATAFLGPGPWGSLAPALPSDPSQAYEGVATLGYALILAVAASFGATGRADGRLLLVAIAGWSFLRAAVSVTWRDPAVVGPLGVAGVLAAAIGVGAVVLLIGVLAAARRGAGGGGDPATAGSGSLDAEIPTGS
jgi:prolipoprotein diacylglyceryltransferase